VIALTTSILLVLLALTAAIILLVANGDSSNTSVLRQSTLTNPVGESERPIAP
jgi:hypothetical protein